MTINQIGSHGDNLLVLEAPGSLMTSDSNKEMRLILLAVIFVCILQIAGFAYMRKKFDDNIKILQSSETLMAHRVETIEKMLYEMHQASDRSNSVSKMNP
jgi:hypothetical protein